MSLSPDSSLIVWRKLASQEENVICALEHAATPHPWSLRNYQDSVLNAHPIWLACQQSLAPNSLKNEKVEKQDGEADILGFFVVLPVLDELELLNIVVAQPYQGQGWGKVLLAKLETEAIALGARRILLEVRASNTPALRLYQGGGFTINGRRRNYYPSTDGREDAILLERQLKPCP